MRNEAENARFVHGPAGAPLMARDPAARGSSQKRGGGNAGTQRKIERRTMRAFKPAPALSSMTPRAWLYAVLEEGHVETPLARVVETVLIALIIANVVAAALETVPSIDAVAHAYFRALERFSVVAYTIEYLVRLWSCREDPRVARKGPVWGRVWFAFRPLMVIDFLAFAPSYLSLFLPFDLRVLRIFRLFRLLKLARYSQALPALLNVLYAERAALFASVILLLATMCAGAELMHFAEGAVQPDTLGTIPGAMYWAIATLTTVGYGDVTPVTALGKIVAGVFMVLGLALFALPIGIIANGFVSGLHRRRFAITWSLLKRQPILDGLDADALHEVMDAAAASIVREHAHIAIAGETAETLALIVSGTAVIEGVEGAPLLETGGVVGYEALYHGESYAHTITALSDMHLVELPTMELRRLARKFPALRERLQPSADKLVRRKRSSGRLADLEAENARLRELVIELTLDRRKRKQAEAAEKRAAATQDPLLGP